MALLLVMCGCNDRLLLYTPSGPEDSGESVDSDDTFESEETGTPDSAEDTGEQPQPCGAGDLGPEDGASLIRDEELTGKTASVHFGMVLRSGLAQGEARVWVQGGLGCVGDFYANEEWQGAYLLGVDDWERGVLPEASEPLVSGECEAGGSPYQPSLHLSGLSTNPSAPGEAVWLANDAIEDDSGRMVHFATTPSGPTSIEDADATLLTRGDAGMAAGDIDGDGLDDLLHPDWGNAVEVFLAPFEGELTDADADLAFEVAPGDDFAWSGHVPEVFDLDEDGYADLLWGAGPREQDGVPVHDVFLVQGPLAARGQWDAADGVLLGNTGEPDSGASSGVRGMPSNIRGVGDVTGDGRPDVTIYAADDAYGEPGSSVLYVLDHVVEGTEEIVDLRVRLVGLARDDGAYVGLAGLTSGGSGDVNGDGNLDLAVFHYFTGLSSGIEYRSYVVPGPITGQVDLASEAVNIRIPSDDEGDENQTAIVRDLDDDGLDDIVVSTVNAMDPGVVWLFAGCSEW